MAEAIISNKHSVYSSKIRWFIFSLIVISVVLSWSGIIDRYTTAYIDDALIEAGSAFLIARGMNALISFLQSVTFEFSVGVGGSVGAGEILDPLNDLVEQYSSAMKLAIGSLVIQKVLLEIVSDTFFKIILSISALSVLISSLLPGVFTSGYLKMLLLRCFLALLFLRFALVVVVAANGLVDRAFLYDRTQQQMHILESIEGVQDQGNQLINPALSRDLTEDISSLQLQLATISQTLQKLEQQQPMAQQELGRLEQQLNNLLRELGVLQRLNYLNPDPRVEQLTDKIKQRRTMQQRWQNEQQSLLRQQADIRNQIQLAELALEGKTPGFFAAIANSFNSLGDGIAAVKDAVNPRQVYQLKQRLDNAVTNILNVMALFFLKTLLLPLLFLYMLNKGFKVIWQSKPIVI
ncbi:MULTISPECIES: hypothetical protein [unclassified Arsukibacterium]|uniref:hypothetical protein n=1 Tax=unclassified Arsukibacterium TaxID=2635278 RepID=UPI000C605626|nr:MULTISPECIES: hypothetical protein [unclassified Arsukibacterium]MAA93876.1 hypothetical protein [Rheinheimera sp.]MBM33327.1 hypothetical protein [Rheinheimera sp.]|tara:strand:+ start:68161 stop:69381 length:1221 start_codon:yes stop_codon:yes gene_type:complete